MKKKQIRLGLAAVAVAATVGTSTMYATPSLSSALIDTSFPVQLVTVDTPTRADKELLQTLGLDLTEHAGHDFVEVVLHKPADLDALLGAGLGYDVRIPDLVKRESEINELDEAYAAATVASPLPSGRDAYRTLADFNADMDKLAVDHPSLVKGIELNHTSLEGRTVRGVEISSNVQSTTDGKPVFLIMGVHHAREWPSGEHTMEFAIDLARNYGQDPRITALLDKARVIAVPVINVDGFDLSRTQGGLIDLRAVDGGDIASIFATPGNAYKRKNCRVVDGLAPLAGECAALASPGGYGVGVDPNRNYGGLWGGPGASDVQADPTYRGPAPFSEPETQNVRELVSSRQVTMLITNHTFSNLVLRPNGVAPGTIGPDGQPVGNAPDEPGLKAVGARMAAENGYANQHGWELYDTTGTTEDWSYNATGGYGYTFEIGPNEFHPPFEQVVDMYVTSGAGDTDGLGNRDAYLDALTHAADTAYHGVITGRAPTGATLRLKKSFKTPTWSSTIDDTLDTTTVVGANNTYTWHVNPSTRPVVAEKAADLFSTAPTSSQTLTSAAPLPLMSTDVPFKISLANDATRIKLDWGTPDDLDLEVFRKNADGSLTLVGSSAKSMQEKEQVVLEKAPVGDYVLRVTNYTSVALSFTATVETFTGTGTTVPGLVEKWKLTCERNGVVIQSQEIVIGRGETVKADLACGVLTQGQLRRR